MSDKKSGIKVSLNKFNLYFGRVKPYLFVSFLIFVGLIYGYMLLKITTLASQEPTPTQVTSKVKAAKVPVIDAEVVNQLKALEDNSESVQSLFNEARNNPF